MLLCKQKHNIYYLFHKNLMNFTKKASILFLFILSIFATGTVKAQFITDSVNGVRIDTSCHVVIDTISEVVMDTAQFEDIYLPEDAQFIPADVLYHSNWNNTDVKLRSEKLFEKNARYILPLVKCEEHHFVYPCDNGKVISPFGYRGRRIHTGTDIKLNLNDDVYASFDGVVRMAKRYSGYGNVVVIRHYNGLETLYGHLNKIKVKVNQKVKSGDVIGLGGRTGRATTTHLHFETRFLGDAFNSNKLVDYDKFKLLNDTIIITKNTFNLRKGNSNDDVEEVYIINKKGKKVKVKRRVKHKTKGKAKVKSKGKQTKSKSTSDKNSYEVKQGETLGEIAKRNHTTVKKLQSINKIGKKKMIRAGQKIKVD